MGEHYKQQIMKRQHQNNAKTAHHDINAQKKRNHHVQKKRFFLIYIN
jgi:hypothetical protein